MGKPPSSRPNRRHVEDAKNRAKDQRNDKARKINFPRVTLEESLRVPHAIKQHNGGNAWETEEVAKALGLAPKANTFFYIAAASRDFGLTTGSRDTKSIELTPDGRNLVYAPDPETERTLKTNAFLSVDLFRQVLEYFKGSDLPEMKYLSNTLESKFGLPPSAHEEFSTLFRENCSYLGISSGFQANSESGGVERKSNGRLEERPSIVTLAEPDKSSGKIAFIIMPFVEREATHASGFFQEVLRSLITPAARDAGFTVRTANRQGSDLIQSTIINDLLGADLVIADLTEHNPNVLFELGVRMAFDKPVALMKAQGTSPIFDVDNMLRVYEYNASLWRTTLEKDLPNLKEHIDGAWEAKDSGKTYMKILRQAGAEDSVVQN